MPEWQTQLLTWKKKKSMKMNKYKDQKPHKKLVVYQSKQKPQHMF